jgi:hypothetical protein
MEKKPLRYKVGEGSSQDIDFFVNEDCMGEDARLERPSRVTAAVYLLYLSLGFMAAQGLLECSVPGGNQSEGFGVLGTLPVSALFYYMIGKGQNWARITFLLLFILSIPLLVTRFPSHPVSGSLGIGRSTLEITEIAIELAALSLLFQRVSSDWFGAVSGPLINQIKSIIPSLRNTDQPVLSYIWRAWLITFIPAFLIGVITSQFGEPVSLPDRSVMSWIVGALLIAPWVETLVMWPVLGVLKRLVRRPLWVAVASGVIFGLLHLRGWGTPQMWGFFIFSLCFLEWQKKSIGRAITVTALVHMCHNLIPVSALVLAVLFGVQPPPQDAARSTASPPHSTAAISGEKDKPSGEASIAVAQSRGTHDLSTDENYRSFKKAFPYFGKNEFELASDDLYPHWKKTAAPNGTWDEFLLVYRDFVQWWDDNGL